jgi:hypothetical protein
VLEWVALGMMVAGGVVWVMTAHPVRDQVI